MQTTNPTRQLQDARQIKRLRALREQTALQALRAAEAAQHAAEQTVQQCQTAFEKLHTQSQELAERIVGEYAPHIGRWIDHIAALQSGLDDDLERVEDELMEAEQALDAAQENTALARERWQRAVGQHSSADTLVAEKRTTLARHRETLLEREDEPPASSALTSIESVL